MLRICKFTSLMSVCLPFSGIFFFYCVRTHISWDITASLATNLYLRNKLNLSLIWSPPDDLGNWKDLPGEVGVLCPWLLWVSPPQVTLGLKEIPLSPQELCAPPTCDEPLWGPADTSGEGRLAEAGRSVCTCCYLHLVLARLEHGALFSLHVRFLSATKWSWSKNLYRIMGWEGRRKKDAT